MRKKTNVPHKNWIWLHHGLCITSYVFSMKFYICCNSATIGSFCKWKVRTLKLYKNNTTLKLPVRIYTITWPPGGALQDNNFNCNSNCLKFSKRVLTWCIKVLNKWCSKKFQEFCGASVECGARLTNWVVLAWKLRDFNQLFYHLIYFVINWILIGLLMSKQEADKVSASI